MKLAEALAERKAAQTKIAELNERLMRVALVQETEKPAEDPSALLQELETVCARLEQLIIAINRTNMQATLTDGRGVMDAIAARDVLRMKRGVIDALLRSATNTQMRARATEIRLVATVSVSDLQTQRDALAKAYRELDTAIQAANWATDLLEG